MSAIPKSDCRSCYWYIALYILVIGLSSGNEGWFYNCLRYITPMTMDRLRKALIDTRDVIYVIPLPFYMVRIVGEDGDEH